MAKDPYKYFRLEARELLETLVSGALELERGGGTAVVARLLRQAHTLKGAARIVTCERIGQLAHDVESLLAPFREAGLAVPRQVVENVLALLGKLREELELVGQGPGGQPAGGAPPTGPAAAAGPAVAVSTPRAAAGGEPPAAGPAKVVSPSPPAAARNARAALSIELADLESLLETAGTVQVQLSTLRQVSALFDELHRLAAGIVDKIAPRPAGAGAGTGRAERELRAQADELLGMVDRAAGTVLERLDSADRSVGQIAGDLDRLRLVGVRSLFVELELAARNSARVAGKRVAFEARGGETRLDAHVLASLRESLVHLVQNAVAHGVESESDRIAAGKPPAGSVSVTFRRVGQHVSVTCHDDGRGIDVEAVRAAAIRRGTIDPAGAAELDVSGAVRLLLQGGLTTSRAVDELSGRGVGLDVVQNVAQRLKGRLDVQSEPGHGTSFVLEVPVSLLSFPGLLVEVHGRTVSIPLDSVVRVSIRQAAELQTGGAGAVLLEESTALPFAPLASILRWPVSAERHTWHVVIVRSGRDRVAVGVDRIVRVALMVSRPLPRGFPPVPLVAGAGLDADGNPVLVLDARQVVVAASGIGPQAPTSPVARRLPVLVVDDSLTTRMMEQSILESAGYEVDLAASGEEAMAMSRRRGYGAFVVDVEMPGMDGFEFVASTRADPELKDVPAVLVTSLGSPEHRRRGMEVGARAYIAKDEFNQDEFLRILRGLVG